MISGIDACTQACNGANEILECAAAAEDLLLLVTRFAWRSVRRRRESRQSNTFRLVDPILAEAESRSYFEERIDGEEINRSKKEQPENSADK